MMNQNRQSGFVPLVRVQNVWTCGLELEPKPKRSKVNGVIGQKTKYHNEALDK